WSDRSVRSRERSAPSSGRRRLPRHLYDGAAGRLVVFDFDHVIARPRCRRRPILRRGLVAPGVDQQRSIDPQPDSIVAAGDERIPIGGERKEPLPAAREVVVADPVAWAPVAPIVADARLVPREDPAATHGRAAVVLGAEFATW